MMFSHQQIGKASGFVIKIQSPSSQQIRKLHLSSVSKYPQLWIFHYKPTNQVINTVIFVLSNLLFSEVISHFNSCSLSDVVLCTWHEAKTMSLWVEGNNVKRQCPWKAKLTENEFFSWMFQSNSSLYTFLIKY